MDDIVIKDIFLDHNRRDLVLGSAFLLRFCGGILLVLFVPFAISGGDATLYGLCLILAIGISFRSLGVIDLYFRSQQYGRISAISHLVAITSVFGVSVLCIVFAADLVWFAVSIALEHVVFSVVLVCLYCRDGRDLSSWRPNLLAAKSLMSRASPLIFSGLMVVLYMRIDQVMIRWILDEKSLGIYSAAVLVSESWCFIPMAITFGVFPAVLESRRISETSYLAQLERLYALLFWFPLIVAIVVWPFSAFALGTLFGPAYESGALTLVVLMFSGVFVFLGVGSSKWFVAEELQKFQLYRTIVGLATNIVLNIALIPALGIVGAATATLVSYGVSVWLATGIFRESRPNFALMSRVMNPAYCVRSFFCGRDK